MDFALKRFLIPVVVALISASFLLVIRGVIFRLMHRRAEKTGPGTKDPLRILHV